MAKKEPTLADIWQKLGNQDSTLSAIHEQVRKTNGRVTKVEQWKDRVEQREIWAAEWTKDHSPTPQEKAEGWTAREKTLTSIIISLIAILSGLAAAGKL